MYRFILVLLVRTAGNYEVLINLDELLSMSIRMRCDLCEESREGITIFHYVKSSARSIEATIDIV